MEDICFGNQLREHAFGMYAKFPKIFFRYRSRISMCTAQKMKFSIQDIFSKCDQIYMKLRIWSHLLKKSLTENFIFLAVFKI